MSLWDLRWLSKGVESVQSRHRERVRALFGGAQPAQVVAIAGRFYGRSHGLLGDNSIDMLEQPRAWLEDVLSDMAEHVDEAGDEVTFRPLVIELDALGVHFIDALFGAPVYFRDGQVWSEGLPGELVALEMPDLSDARPLQQALELARLAVETSQGRLLVSVPVLSCPINIGMNLYGGSLLEAMMLAPERAARALRIITDVIAAATRAFMEVIPEPIRCGFVASNRYAPAGFTELDGCATHLLSGVHYQRFVAPLDRELLQLAPRGGMLHLCGAHTQHLPAWREMRELRAVQLNDRATEDLESYCASLRTDQVLYVSPTPLFPVERILAVTEARRLVLQWSLEQPIPVASGTD